MFFLNNVVILIYLSINISHADIYKHRDSDGRIYYTATHKPTHLDGNSQSYKKSTSNSSKNSLSYVSKTHGTRLEQKIEKDTIKLNKYGKYYALVIGNNKYEKLSNLNTAINDAKVISKLLENRYDFSVETLINVTRSEIIGTLSKYRKFFSNKDNFLIYYAGHGWLDKDADEGYWLPIDADKENPSNWISNSTITSFIRAINAKHIMVVADSCYSGKLARGLRMAGVKERNYYEEISQKKSRTVLTSGGLEPVADGGGKSGHSVFASAFIDTLLSNTVILEGDAVFLKIKRPVILNSDQTPVYSDLRKVGHNGGDFLFIPTKLNRFIKEKPNK